MPALAVWKIVAQGPALPRRSLLPQRRSEPEALPRGVCTNHRMRARIVPGVRGRSVCIDFENEPHNLERLVSAGCQYSCSRSSQCSSAASASGALATADICLIGDEVILEIELP
jgi:hypothetical protein